MDIRKYEYQPEFARHHYARGKAAGFAVIIARLLAARFGRIEASVNERIERATLAELEVIGERLLTAATLQEALGPE
jgi:Domain of unknown function (DUF4351)